MLLLELHKNLITVTSQLILIRSQLLTCRQVQKIRKSWLKSVQSQAAYGIVSSRIIQLQTPPPSNKKLLLSIGYVIIICQAIQTRCPSRAERAQEKYIQMLSRTPRINLLRCHRACNSKRIPNLGGWKWSSSRSRQRL